MAEFRYVYDAYAYESGDGLVCTTRVEIRGEARALIDDNDLLAVGRERAKFWRE